MAAIYCGEDVGGSGLRRSTPCGSSSSWPPPTRRSRRSCRSTTCARGWSTRTARTNSARSWVPRLASMEAVASYCLTEPGAGSDAGALRTKAVRDGDHYVLDGVKQFISGAGVSDVYVVMARTGGDGPRGISAFIVEKDTPGVSFGAERGEDGLERPAHRAGDLRRCPGSCRRDARRRRRRGHRLLHRDERLNGGRINIAACSLGGAQAAYDKAVSYLRRPGGVRRRAARRADHPVHTRRHGHRAGDVANAVVAGGIRARRRLTPTRSSCARWPSATSPTPASTSPIRRCNCTAATDISREYGLEKIVRDLRVHRILEGTNEIMRVVIGRAAGRPASRQKPLAPAS